MNVVRTLRRRRPPSRLFTLGKYNECIVPVIRIPSTYVWLCEWRHDIMIYNPGCFFTAALHHYANTSPTTSPAPPAPTRDRQREPSAPREHDVKTRRRGKTMCVCVSDGQRGQRSPWALPEAAADVSEAGVSSEGFSLAARWQPDDCRRMWLPF